MYNNSNNISNLTQFPEFDVTHNSQKLNTIHKIKLYWYFHSQLHEIKPIFITTSNNSNKIPNSAIYPQSNTTRNSSKLYLIHAILHETVKPYW